MTRKEQLDFYIAHSRRLYNISLRIVRDSGLAEEIMQDTILKFLTGKIRILGEVQSAAWLNKTCIRSSIDALRRKIRERAFLSEAKAEAKEEEAKTEAEEEIDTTGGEADLTDVKISEVMAAMSRLDEPYRLILNLILVEGLDYHEVSVLTGLKEGTIRTRYSRGRSMLLELLGKKKKNG